MHSSARASEALEHVACGNWKGLSHYRVHSLYKGHLPIADNLMRSRGVRNSEVPLYTQCHDCTCTMYMYLQCTLYDVNYCLLSLLEP